MDYPGEKASPPISFTTPDQYSSDQLYSKILELARNIRTTNQQISNHRAQLNAVGIDHTAKVLEEAYWQTTTADDPKLAGSSPLEKLAEVTQTLQGLSEQMQVLACEIAELETQRGVSYGLLCMVFPATLADVPECLAKGSWEARVLMELIWTMLREREMSE